MTDLTKMTEKADDTLLDPLIDVQIDLEKFKTALDGDAWSQKCLDPTNLLRRLKALSETLDAITATVKAKT